MRSLLHFGAILTAAAFISAARYPFIVYNPSPSIPPGLYVRVPGQPTLGGYATVRAVLVAPGYSATRNFIGPSDRFIKRVAARVGQRICVSGFILSLDGRPIAKRQSRDAAGRVLPAWSGCRTLNPGEVLLMGDAPDSFDGRYWGPTPLSFIDGAWRPLFGARPTSPLPSNWFRSLPDLGAILDTPLRACSDSCGPTP